MAKKRHKSLSPRRKRMTRSARLQAARHWLPTYTGPNILRGYAKWYGVDWNCAIKELEALGVAFDPAYAQSLRTTLANRAAARAERRQREIEEKESQPAPGVESDYYFYYIAGYTSGGAPYGITCGITWEEAEYLGLKALDEE